MSHCIAYLPDGHLCRRPATILNARRGGLVCTDHAPDPDDRPLHPVTGEEMPYCLAPVVDRLAEADLPEEERQARIDFAARFRA
jgi:hypothetical protein